MIVARIAVIAGSWLALAVVGACSSADGEATSAARFAREIPWAGRGTWIAADTHAHTKFSDGANTPAEVVAKAVAYGCRVVAITDHADGNLTAATPEYEAAIKAVRLATPGTVVLAGLEWNVPPWGGDEHATVLPPPGENEWKTLAEFKRRFDDYHRADHASLDALEALRWLAANGAEGGVSPVVIYNHPSRKDAKSIENVADIKRWRTANDLVIGFEGAPGHQAMTPVGGYQYLEKPIDRWDPAVARVGDAWDTLLQAGINLTGATVTSDFHGAESGQDRWPCEFSETWFYVPDVSASGVLRALRSGAFFGVHGKIARNVELTVETAGLSRPAIAGESIEVSPGASVTAALNLVVPATDWAGQANRIDELELIAVTRKGASVVAKGSGTVLRHTLTASDGPFFVRARGRRVMPEGPALMFYTNPIQIVIGR